MSPDGALALHGLTDMQVPNCRFLLMTGGLRQLVPRPVLLWVQLNVLSSPALPANDGGLKCATMRSRLLPL